jgi:phosphoribosylformylglycinamidine synthase
LTWIARVHVVLKAIVNDPQGEAIRGGLRSLGFSGVSQVRAGKYLEIHLDAEDRADAEHQVDDMCRRLLANPVIEDYRIEVERASTAPLDAV